jgi:mannose-6-phosphate isomerase-like protein (cupin superfamily)
LPDGVKAPFGHAYGYLENGKMMELHAHPTAEIYIVYSGAGSVVVGDERREVFPGDVINIPPNEMHSMVAQENGTFLWAAFWWDAIK